MQKLKDRLKAEREALGWSQLELARAAKIRQSFIGALEAGNQKSSGYVPEIAHALGVDAYWLKTGKGHKHGALSSPPPEVAALADRIAKLPPSARQVIEAVVAGQEATEGRVGNGPPKRAANGH